MRDIVVKAMFHNGTGQMDLYLLDTYGNKKRIKYEELTDEEKEEIRNFFMGLNETDN